MPYFAYIVGGWVQKEGKFCLRNKSMAPKRDQNNQSDGSKMGKYMKSLFEFFPSSIVRILIRGKQKIPIIFHRVF